MSNLQLTRSVKEDVLQLIARLPDDATLEEIQYQLAVRAKVGNALRALDEGRVFSQDEVERMSEQWLKSSGQNQP